MINNFPVLTSNSFKFKSLATDNFLTVIITMRAGEQYDMIDRLYYRKLDTNIPDLVRFVIVDQGSPPDLAQKIKMSCIELDFQYLRMESSQNLFCASSARNFGASMASSKFIMHEDIDLFPYPGFYKELVDEIGIQGMFSSSCHFISVPVMYLSEKFTKLALNSEISKNEILQDFLKNGGGVETYLPASSCIVVNRMYYLSIGGYCEKFNGWGLEDLEFAYRMTRSAKAFKSPKDHGFLIEGGYSSFSVYKGWRSQFRLHGELLGRKSIVLFHAWHPKDQSWRNELIHKKNKLIYTEECKNFDRLGHTLQPIASFDRGKSLIFGKGTFAYNRALLPFWGDLEVRSYEDFLNIDIVDYVKENLIDRIIFTNPYANELREKIYTRIREAGISYLVVERGALTDSMFIDDTGFCCESTRYKRRHWPELDDDRQKRVYEYISKETASEDALEKQAGRLGARVAREKLGVPQGKKILFVPFQSRSDITVRKFAGPIGSFDNFVDLVSDVTKNLNYQWIVLFKNHPLSLVKESIPGAIDVDDMHIKDLLELADYVLLMNSGVGVLATLFNKPVIYTSKAFYADDDLNKHACNVADVLNILDKGFSVDRVSRIRFLSYLIEDFYSFGRFTVSEKAYTKEAKLTITNKIDYYRVAIIGECLLEMRDKVGVYDIKAPIYDIYRESIIIDSKTKIQKKVSLNKSLFNNGGKYRLIERNIFKVFIREKSKYKKYINDRVKFFHDSNSFLARIYYILRPGR